MLQELAAAAQQIAQQSASQATPEIANTFDPSTYSFDSIAIPGMVGAVIHWLKGYPRFSWISDKTPNVTRIVGAVAASLTAAGMNIDWVHEQAGLAITIHGVTAASISLFAWTIAKNYFFQNAAVVALDLHAGTRAAKLESAAIAAKAEEVKP